MSHAMPAAAQHGPGDAEIQHLVHRDEAHALGAAPSRSDSCSADSSYSSTLLGNPLMNLPHRVLPSARRLQRQPADADVAGHHALAGEHLEDPENVLALAEAIEKHGHRADVQSVSPQPHQMAVQSAEAPPASRASIALSAESRCRRSASPPPARRPDCSRGWRDNRRGRSASPPAARS